MSLRRIVVSCALVALMPVGIAIAQTTAASNDIGPLEKAARPITPENPIPRRLDSPAAEYPADAAAVSAEATVTLRVTLDGSGRVAEVRQIAITARGKAPEFSVNLTSAGVRDRNSLLAMQLGPADAALAVRALDAVMKSATDTVKRWSYEPPADAPISFTVAFGFRPDTAPTATQTEAPPGGTLLRQWTAEGAVRVGGNIKPPTKIHDVRPVYPNLAQSARVQGVVIIEARIEPDGTVSNAHVTRSIPLLDQGALDSVMQWRFTPTLVDGKAVPVIMTVTVNFTLR